LVDWIRVWAHTLGAVLRGFEDENILLFVIEVSIDFPSNSKFFLPIDMG
jgi:hypothetical protein